MRYCNLFQTFHVYILARQQTQLQLLFYLLNIIYVISRNTMAMPMPTGTLNLIKLINCGS